MSSISSKPEGVKPPMQLGRQFSLFPEQRDDVLARAQVSLDDLVRWQRLGWISYNASSLETMEDDEIAEMMFVRDIARAGLSDALVAKLLSDLPKPYAYSPRTTVYSFNYGWVQLPSEMPMDEVMESRFDRWVEEKVLEGEIDRLEAIATRIMAEIDDFRARQKKEQD